MTLVLKQFGYQAPGACPRCDTAGQVSFGWVNSYGGRVEGYMDGTLARLSGRDTAGGLDIEWSNVNLETVGNRMSGTLTFRLSSAKGGYAEWRGEASLSRTSLAAPTLYYIDQRTGNVTIFD
jgi:hypothetical protein